MFSLSLLKKVIQNDITIKAMKLEKADVLVYDSEGANILKRMVLNGLSTFALPSRDECYYISDEILSQMVIWTNRLSIPYNLLGDNTRNVIKFVYFLACISVIKPKVVITYTDNDAVFHRLSRTYNKASRTKFIAVQNGARLEYEFQAWPLVKAVPKEISDYYYYFCYGKREEDMGNKYKHVIGKYCKVGSMAASYYWHELREKITEKRFDICLVSEYEKSVWDETTEQFRCLKKNYILLHSHLKKYVQEKKIKLCIALRDDSVEEYVYYRQFFGDEVSIVPSNRDRMSTYVACNESNMVVGTITSVLPQMLSFGKKILAFNMSYVKYTLFDKCILSHAESSYESFSKHLEYLIKMPEKEYENKISGICDYYISGFLKNREPVHKDIRDKIMDLLK